MSAPRAFAVALVVTLASSCTRPVDGRDPGATRLVRVDATPTFIRAGVPIEAAIEIDGADPTAIELELAGRVVACAPARLRDGVVGCTVPALSIGDVPEGATLLVASVTDTSGRRSVASTPVAIDFACPRVVAMTVSSGAVRSVDADGAVVWVGAPGDVLVVSIEASEELAAPPEVSRFGSPYAGVAGQGRTFGFSRRLGPADAPQRQPIVARLRDLAGNTSDACDGGGALALAVDASAPVVDGQRVFVRRDAPGLPSVLTASVGAFVDDVGVREVQLFDEADTLVATVTPRVDGAIPETSLRVQPTSRLSAVAVDLRGRTSAPVTVSESWRLSLGAGSAPGAALRTGARFSLAAPGTPHLANRTTQAAPDVFAADGRQTRVRATVGFERVGELPAFFESRWGIVSGYDAVGNAVVTFGGALGTGNAITYGNRTTIVRWDEALGAYRAENGPAPAWGQTPHERWGTRIAFDGTGCGVLFGGDGVIRPPSGAPRFFLLNDVWRVCAGPDGYRWREIVPGLDGLAEAPIFRIAPITWDPLDRRYVVVQGQSGAFGRPFDDAFFLLPGPTPDAWKWAPFDNLPDRFNNRRRHLQFWDPRLQGLTIALGAVQPIGQGEQGLAWVRRRGQWLVSQVPRDLEFREDFDADFDAARGQLVLFGGDDQGGDFPRDGAVWLMTRTATHGAAAWRRSGIDPVLPRYQPSVVYDAAREVTLVFGGVRLDRFVPAEVQALQLEPTWPVAQLTLDLGAARPRGLTALALDVRATARGDADGTGPGTAVADGVEVFAWSTPEARWVRVAEGVGPLLSVRLGADVDRFVSPAGRVELTVRARHPATEGVDAELALDLVDGALTLQGGLPRP